MLTGIPQSVVIFLTGLIYYGVDFRLMRYYERRSSPGPRARSWRYTFLMIGFWILLAVQPVLLPEVGMSTTARWGLAIQAAGAASITCGLALHWWARSHLQHFYVEDVLFQEGQYLVDTGPYSRVRHPVFTSFFLIAMGMLLVNPALITLAMVIYVTVDFSSAAREEETLLLEKLPEYAKYMERTGRFFPKWQH
jgi:protein-S-isoprenylcysteine O-methyltransferase Ste14